MHARLALSVFALLVATAPAFPAKFTDQLLAGPKLECLFREHGSTLSDIFIINRSSSTIPAQTYIEVSNGAGTRLTVIAPQGIVPQGNLSVRDAHIRGDTCTAKTVMVNAP